MKRLFILSLLIASTQSFAQTTATLKKFDLTCEEWPEGEPPKEVFIVDGTIKVSTLDGSKVLMIEPAPITDASAQLAVSANGAASIEARALAIRRGRSTPRFGISVHGMSGPRLIVNPAKKSLDLMRNDQILVSVPFVWTSEVWLKLQLTARKSDGDAWLITGKAWPADAAEPTEPLVKHEDKGLKGQGKCAIWATPFSGEPIFFDDVHIEVELPPAP